MTLPKWLQSSEDEAKLALTVKGVLTTIVPVILIISNAKGWHITQSSLDAVIDAILNVLAVLGTVIGAIVTLIGAVRKVVYAYKDSKSNPQ